jgi:ABC-type Fe3+ transport system permease subunit
MTLGGLGGESNRVRIGLAFLLMGLLLLAWSWGSWVYRTSATQVATAESPTQSEDASDPLSPEKKAVAARSLTLVLLTIFALFLAVLLGSFVIVRYGRNYFAMHGRGKTAPTTNASVWEMHQPPPLNDDQRESGPDALHGG